VSKSSFGAMDECRTCSIRPEGTLNTDIPMAINQFRISTAAVGKRRLRVANLVPEVSDGVLRLVLSGYREVMDIQVESWSRFDRYTVAIGIRLAMITLAPHIASQITVAGQSADGIRWATYGVLWL
jgi:hypothetical protein